MGGSGFHRTQKAESVGTCLSCLVLSEDDSLCSCLEDYCSILLFPYSISSGGAL